MPDARSLTTATLTVIASLLAAVVTLAPTTQVAAQNGLAKGPDPTSASLQVDGPFDVVTVEVSDAATPGFGAATIHHPSDTSQIYAGIVAFPGFTANRSAMQAISNRLASHGFVVLRADTNGPLDFPAARGTQMLSAIDYLRGQSPTAALVDGNRIGVMGHSMGGGGALEAISSDPSIDAAVPFTPWNLDKTWSEVTTPTLIIGAEADTVAPVASHAIPFFTSYAPQTERAYLELSGASHSVPTDPNATISLYTVAWMKRYLDADLRYTPFICPGTDAASDPAISEYESSCDPTGIPPTPPDPTATTILPTVTCLAGNGRIDLNVVNNTGDPHLYTVTVGSLSPRANTVAASDWWRSPVTGRPDGPIAVAVQQDAEVIYQDTLDVKCDANPAVSTPEIDLISVCRNGLGFIAWQIANPTPDARVYIFGFEGVSNRSTTAGPFGAAIRGVSGRPDGTYAYTVHADGALATQGSVTVNCS